jgi:hypothetical protein
MARRALRCVPVQLSLYEVCYELVEIHWSVFAFLIVAVLANLLRFEFSQEVTHSGVHGAASTTGGRRTTVPSVLP